MNAVDMQSRSALWLAASEAGKLEYMQALLAAGADINDADAREKLSPIQVRSSVVCVPSFGCSEKLLLCVAFHPRHSAVSLGLRVLASSNIHVSNLTTKHAIGLRCV